ncbi:S1 family peptidase [Lentzea californiensis]|uniref:S1 family peptidase n=1 Tax=Lentzea californiensis TaxID=438851 RepID=UPI002166BA65|nr:S1 family peptidase [Lentzea californiensis]MCR3750337.1 streptogrisin C [Lentzea californiensis]
MRSWKHSLCAALGVAAMALGSTTATAAPPKPTPAPDTTYENLPAADRAAMRAQDKARTAADRIRRAVEAGHGFAGLELHDGGVRLWYQGTVPTAVRTAVDDARRTAPVEVLPARYSLAELTAASDRVVDHLRAHPGGPAHRVSIAVDGSGLTVGVDGTSGVRSAGLPDVGAPVQVVVQDRVRPAGRSNDTSPFYGGGYLVAQERWACSAGFGVWRGGRKHLLTAGHCGRPGQTWRNGNQSLAVGTAVDENPSQDLLLIAASADSHIFTGVQAGTSIGHVIGWQGVFTGEELCSSAATTTWLCGHVVLDAGNSSYCGHDAYGTWECYTGLVRSRQEDNVIAVRSGDSGGPVVLPTPSGVIAKGMISGGSGADLLWQDFATANAIWGVTPVV